MQSAERRLGQLALVLIYWLRIIGWGFVVLIALMFLILIFMALTMGISSAVTVYLAAISRIIHLVIEVVGYLL